MMKFDEYRAMDATDLAGQIACGNLSAEEVLDCAIDRALAVNPKINAIVTPYYDDARQYVKARPLTGVFAGVPMLLKDLVGEWKGHVTGNGSAACRYDVSTRTSTLFQRYSSMGTVFIGKTNTPEFGLLATTEPLANGPSLNPWDLTRSSGGSSGGSAAAVAAGIVPMASAGDGGGSIRIPASCCGLFGLKPSRGLIPSGPYGELWDGAVSEHVITRSVRDSKAVLAASIGADYFSHSPSLVDWETLSARYDEKKPLKIGYTNQSFYGGTVHQDCVDAVSHGVTILRNLGHEVEEVELTLDAEKLMNCYGDIYTAHVNADVTELIRRFGKRFVRDHIEPLTYFIYQIGTRFPAGKFVLSKRQWSAFSNTMEEWHNLYDVLVTPTMAVPPYNIGEMAGTTLETAFLKLSNRLHVSGWFPPELLYAVSKQQLLKVPFTQLANLTGQPAMSVPLYWNDANLPIGVQFLGRRLDDLRLLALASALEEAAPWFTKVPDL
ncbi:amidase [Ketobacter sp.]|uniref:amidase n=1 Tax=Ketobacter sp. TaxID=2083498 RepID=UPI000F13BF8F|nr:amidase family protein [Ketobacter sp.]RLT97399.1 MAG: amidase [Ketobacter sp.]